MKPQNTLNLPKALLPAVALLAVLAVLPAHALTYPQQVLVDGPTVYYRLEELPGASTAVDSSTNGYNGTYTYDQNFVYPILGQAGLDTNSILFHPSTDGNGAEYGYVTIPNSPALSPSNGSPFTAEIWVRPTSLPANGNDYRCPFSDFAGFNSANSGYGGGWLFYLQPGNEFVWDMPYNPGIFLQSSANSAVVGQWAHLVGTYDGTNTIFYVNGVVVSSSVVATNWMPNANTFALIGIRDFGDFPWDGDVDEAAVYPYALSATQIATHYHIGTNSIRVTPTAPSISSSPSSTTNYSGTAVTFTVTADGTAPLHYHWYQNSVLIPGATNSSYTFTSSYSQNGDSYFVNVSNAIGMTNSSAAILTLSTNLLIDAQPYSISREVGSSAAFEVVAEGPLPLTYQWYNATTSTAVAGATNAILTLTNIPLSFNGNNYYAQVTSPFGSLASSTANLAVNARAVNVPITGYARIVVSDKPTAYWRLDETNATGGTATDAVGSFDGTYNNTASGATFTFGLPTGIPNESDPAVGITNGAYVSIPYAIELNPQGAYSAEGWFKPTVVDGNYHTVFSSIANPAGAGPIGWLVYQQASATFALVPYSGFYGQDFITDTTDTVTANTWYHIVVVYDGVARFTLYVNGRAVSGDNFPSYVANGNVPVNGYPTYNYNYYASVPGATALGWRSDLGFSPFMGSMDDVAFYSYALTASQIQTHFLNQVKLSYTTAASKLILSWPFGTLQASTNAATGYTNLTAATSPYTNTISGKSLFYRVKTQ